MCNESFFWEEIVDHKPAQPTNQFMMGHHQPVRLEYLTSLYTAIYQNFLMISFQGWSYLLTIYDRTYIDSGLNKKWNIFLTLFQQCGLNQPHLMFIILTCIGTYSQRKVRQRKAKCFFYGMWSVE